MSRSYISLGFAFVFFFAFADVGFAGPRTLLIGVDAIPYEVARKLTDPNLGEQALFKGLKGPAAVINTFPTGSYVAWTGLLRPLGVAKALGYEACHFDRQQAQLRGCFSLNTVPAPWKQMFDWYLKGIARKAIAYGWPKKYSVSEMEQGFDAFQASDKEFFGMYIVSTDGLGHVYGPEGLSDFLRKLDRGLLDLRERMLDKPFQTVIVSDHGMPGGQPLKNTWPGVKDAMDRAGLHVASSLERENDVVIVKFGLLSSFVLYTRKDIEAKVASVLVSVPGVDLCVLPHHEGWQVASARGDALIQRKQGPAGELWSYQILSGDPLNYSSIVVRLQERAVDKTKTWFPDEWWFDASKDHFYPDALYRLAEGFALVENPASILCSNRPGYMFGSLLTERAAIPTIGRLKWTHGALYRDAAFGFLMSDIPDWPISDAVRFDRALAPLAGLIE
ncbi:MAG: alkaline phosphatase family protein [Gammaproteobacteria bacterium]|nr:alkaline phosphatase family protein [Gammaproteobacteria bacterium]